MKLLIDMNLSPRWVEVLAEAGIEAVHWSMVGAKSAPDIEIMAFAVFCRCRQGAERQLSAGSSSVSRAMSIRRSRMSGSWAPAMA